MSLREGKSDIIYHLLLISHQNNNIQFISNTSLTLNNCVTARYMHKDALDEYGNMTVSLVWLTLAGKSPLLESNF